MLPKTKRLSQHTEQVSLNYVVKMGRSTKHMFILSNARQDLCSFYLYYYSTSVFELEAYHHVYSVPAKLHLKTVWAVHFADPTD